MEEYASRFQVLLKYATRLDAEDRLEEIQVMSLPNLANKRDISRIIDRYQKQASGYVEKKRDPGQSQLKKG